MIIQTASDAKKRVDAGQLGLEVVRNEFNKIKLKNTAMLYFEMLNGRMATKAFGFLTPQK